MVTKWREWKKNHPDFPLTVAPCGQWCKKVRGKTYYFGPLHNPDNAAENWARDKDYLLAGMKPPMSKNGLTVGDLLEKHLGDVDDRVKAGKMAAKSRRDFLPLSGVIQQAGLSNYAASEMGPVQFAAIQRVIENSGRRPRSQKNVVNGIRSVFKWGAGMQLIKAVEYGPRFVAPKAEAIEIEQEENGAMRFIDRETILKAFDAANLKMRVAILLGINCAFYQGDTIAISLDNLHESNGVSYHDFRRAKNGRRRMAVLWPETSAAIKEYCEKQRRPAKDGEKKLVLTQYGMPYTSAGEARKLGDAFGRIMSKIDAKSDGVSIGSLRHTYATVIDSHPDQTMIDLTMGHAGKGMQKRVYKQLNLDELDRLKVISDIARKWLFQGVELELCLAALRTKEEFPVPADTHSVLQSTSLG